MPPSADTRYSLIGRLPHSDDVDAWDEFVEIYEPLLYRLGRGRGLQQADAEDFVQEVLMAVAKSIEEWVSKPDRGHFRAWLFRIASNQAVNFLTRRKHQRLGVGGSQLPYLLEQHPQLSGDSTELFLKEYRKELFRWAAEQVRERTSKRQWMAFWLTSIAQRPVVEVARELKMTVGSVYVARSRVTKRIRDTIQNHQEGKQ